MSDDLPERVREDMAALADEIDAMRRGATTGAESTPINVARLDAWANTARRLRCSHAPSVAAPPSEGADRPPARRRLGGLDAPDPIGSEDAWEDAPASLVEAAFGLICNVDGCAQGWRQSDDWVEAADRWIARYERVTRAAAPGTVRDPEREACGGSECCDSPDHGHVPWSLARRGTS